MRTIVHSDPIAVARRLKELDLTTDVLLNAVTASHQARSNCTELDPKMFPGLTMWATAIRHLRMGLLPRWKVNDEGNYPLTVSPDGSVAISVATADEATGVAGRSPATQSSKGPRTMEAVAANNVQLGFELIYPDGWALPMYDGQRFGDCATWLLLIHSDNSTLRAELSLPLGVDEYRRVSDWQERILLPSIDVDPLREVETDDRQRPIEVPVQRRA
jgi:hypothetical protein